MKAVVLRRGETGPETIVYATESLYDALDELQRLAYRIYGLDEVEVLERGNVK